MERFYGEYYFRPKAAWRVVQEGDFQQRYPAALQGSARVHGPALQAEEVREGAQGRRSPRREPMTPKARLLTFIVILSNVAGNLFLSLGLKSSAGVLSPLVALGVSLLILWTVSRMTLMSWADLSYILPVTAIGYVLSALAGKIFLAEHISLLRWSGTLLIVAGIALVGRTQAETR